MATITRTTQPMLTARPTTAVRATSLSPARIPGGIRVKLSMLTVRPTTAIRSTVFLSPAKLLGERIKSPVLGSSAPRTVPVVSGLAPINNTQLDPGIPIVFDISDKNGLASITIYTLRLDGRDLVYDGSFVNGVWQGSFSTNYQSSEIVVTNTNKNFHFSILKDGGWVIVPTLQIKAINTVGVEA